MRYQKIDYQSTTPGTPEALATSSGAVPPEEVKTPVVGSGAMVSRLLAAVPTNWCDPLLTGPNAALSPHAGKWGCQDIERLLAAIRERLREAANNSGLPRSDEQRAGQSGD